MENTAHVSLASFSLSSRTLSSLALVLLGFGCAAPTSLPDEARGITRSAQRHASDQEQLNSDDEDQEQSVLAATDDPTDEAAMDEPLDETPVPESPEPDPSTFSDDSGRCGNGLLDEDELCDIMIPDGEEGACPTECLAFDNCHSPAIALRTCWTQCVLGEKLPC